MVDVYYHKRWYTNLAGEEEVEGYLGSKVAVGQSNYVVVVWLLWQFAVLQRTHIC